MNEHIKEITTELKEKYGLEQYVLKRDHIFMERTLDNQTNYILSLELVPTNQTEENEDYNPDGTAVLEVYLHTRQLKQIIFVNNVSYANDGTFPTPEIENVIEWIEEITGMMFGRQFKLSHEDGIEFGFQATVDNIDVAPTGNIDITFNEDKQLTQFSIDGVFPSGEDVEWEPFSLMKDDIKEEVKQRLTLVETPIEEEERWVNLWNFNPFFIRNDKSKIILPEAVYQLDTYKDLNITLEWDYQSNSEFSPKEIDFSTEISYEEAMAKVRINPMTENEIQACIEKTKDFMSSMYPDDSGKWTLTGMYPERNYIISEIKAKSIKALERKVKIIISRETYDIANYWDSKFLLEMFDSFADADESVISQDQALEKMIKHVNITPVYIKDAYSDSYYLCGRVDCDVVVDGSTGNVIAINEL